MFPVHLAHGQAWELSGVGVGNVFCIRGVCCLLPLGPSLSTLAAEAPLVPGDKLSNAYSHSGQERKAQRGCATSPGSRSSQPHQPAKISGTIMGSTGPSVRHSLDASVLEFQTLVVPVN